MSDATDNKSFGSALTSMNEIRKRIYCIVGDVFILFYNWLYNITYDV